LIFDDISTSRRLLRKSASNRDTPLESENSICATLRGHLSSCNKHNSTAFVVLQLLDRIGCVWGAGVQQKSFSRWINWRLRNGVIEEPEKLVDQLRDGTVLSTLLTTVTQGVFQPVSQSIS